MSMRRFMINSGCIRDGHAVVEGEVYNHIVKVLRLRAGARCCWLMKTVSHIAAKFTR